MRYLIALILLITLTGSATALDLGNVQKDTKTNTHIGQNPGTPDGREGGEDISTAVIVAAIPFTDTGNTSDNIHDYDAVCPYDGSISPDVVYSYTPPSDVTISVDLCGSAYDTKTYVMDGDLNIIACNDDHYMDEVCGQYVSFISEVSLYGGVEYFIVVDGYGGDSGDYILNLYFTMPYPPCTIICDGFPENEPPLGPDYDDAYNSGCGGSSFGFPFQDLNGDSNGDLVFCGTSGWFEYGGSDFRDTDWFTVIVGGTGTIEWTLDAEQETYGMLLGPSNCDEVGPLENFIVGPCVPGTLILQGDPGEIIWLWVGPTEFTGPPGFEGYEYHYISTFTGLQAGVIATDRVSFDSIKSLYR